ncbi:hypothetical protein C8R45DRAFT_1133348, partial [Mycena sanguinolenta]
NLKPGETNAPCSGQSPAAAHWRSLLWLLLSSCSDSRFLLSFSMRLQLLILALVVNDARVQDLPPRQLVLAFFLHLPSTLIASVSRLSRLAVSTDRCSRTLSLSLLLMVTLFLFLTLSVFVTRVALRFPLHSHPIPSTPPHPTDIPSFPSVRLVPDPVCLLIRCPSVTVGSISISSIPASFPCPPTSPITHRPA